MRTNRVMLAATLLLPLAAFAQDSYKVGPLKEAPPASLAPAIKDALGSEGQRDSGPERKAVRRPLASQGRARSREARHPKGAILFPNLSEGELLGVIRLAVEGHDYRDQSIPPGLYTLRYGLQPVNGDHLGVSVYRDYALLVPAAKDKDLAPIPEKALATRSAESAGATHPAVLLLQAAPDSAKQATMIRDEEKNLWGVVLPLSLSVKGEAAAVPMPVQLVIVGAAMT